MGCTFFVVSFVRLLYPSLLCISAFCCLFFSLLYFVAASAFVFIISLRRRDDAAEFLRYPFYPLNEVVVLPRFRLYSSSVKVVMEKEKSFLIHYKETIQCSS